MSTEPYRLFSTEPAASVDERAGIFGLETEYAILYLPDALGSEKEPSTRQPEFPLIQKTIFRILLSLCKAGSSAGLKGGFFLQNGGLVHLEIFLRHQGDTPVLEAATPECRTPWDLVVYSRAFDHLLDQVSEKSAVELRESGHEGRIVFVKNNLDARGTGYGCHENYLVRHECSRGEKTLFVLGALPVLVTLLPALVVLLVGLILWSVAMLLARLGAIRAAAARVVEFVRARPRLAQNLAVLYMVFFSVLVLPSIWIYSHLLRRIAFRPFTRDLSSFLVTRQILTGNGSLNFERGCYELSQRTELTSTLANIVLFGKRKTVFDLKGLLYEPLSIFRHFKKLSLTMGDSTLSDVSTLLKIGPTALILEMIENGESFADLRLANPLRAFRKISREGPWKHVDLVFGAEAHKSAIEIQRGFLQRARMYFSDRTPGRLRHQKILDLWEETLERLAERPQALADTLDWTAKKSILDRVILGRSDWKVFFTWGRLFHFAGLAAATEATDLDDLIARTPWTRRRRVRSHAQSANLDSAEFVTQQELYFEARKIDLRYHELGGEGYQRLLEGDGLIRRLTVDEDVERATQEAPRDTRARVRGYYIRLSPTPESLQVNWNEIELLSPSQRIPTPDPFYHRLPGD